MKFTFNAARATQAAAFLVAKAGGSLNYTKLIKLLYLADRASLVETGSPITGDSFVNMEHGPVLSAVYDYVKGSVGNACWARTFEREGFHVVMKQDPGRDELSEFSIEVLARVYEDHRDRSYGQMIDFVHTLPEWKEPTGVARATDLDYANVLRGAGVSEEALAEYEELNASSAPLAEIARHR